MNNSTLASSDGSNPNHGCPALRGFGYALELPIGVLMMFYKITYASSLCRRFHDDTPTLNHPSFASRSFRNAAPEHVTIQLGGLDEATLSSYPQLFYSEVIKPHRHESDVVSVCSICLADYKEDDLLRLLPDCGHLFHLNCIDP